MKKIFEFLKDLLNDLVGFLWDVAICYFVTVILLSTFHSTPFGWKDIVTGMVLFYICLLGLRRD